MTEEIVRADVLGVSVSATSMDSAVHEIERWIAHRTNSYVCVTGAHGIIESRSDAELQSIHNNAGLVVADGRPVMWVLRALGHSDAEQVYGPDLMRAVTARSAEQGYRQFYFGGGDGVADILAQTLSAQYPALQVVGTYTPPFRAVTPEEDDEIVARINAAKPDIVWVGLSTPKQERWMAAHRGRIEAPVMLGVGAAFDFIPGLKTQAPVWMRQRGLEWFYRLVTEPRRLGRRYLHIVPTFGALAIAQVARARTGFGADARATSSR